MRRVTARASRRLPQAPERVFDYVMPVELSTVIKRWGPLPGVKGVRDQSGEWDHVGATRTVLLEDGSSAHEELTAVNRPHHFGYSSATCSIRRPGAENALSNLRPAAATA